MQNAEKHNITTLSTDVQTGVLMSTNKTAVSGSTTLDNATKDASSSPSSNSRRLTTAVMAGSDMSSPSGATTAAPSTTLFAQISTLYLQDGDVPQAVRRIYVVILHDNSV